VPGLWRQRLLRTQAAEEPVQGLCHIHQDSASEYTYTSRSLKIVKNALSIWGLYRTKSVGALSHTLGGARKRIVVHQNGTTSSYILRRPAFWGCTKTLRPPKEGQKEGGRGRQELGRPTF